MSPIFLSTSSIITVTGVGTATPTSFSLTVPVPEGYRLLSLTAFQAVDQESGGVAGVLQGMASTDENVTVTFFFSSVTNGDSVSMSTTAAFVKKV